LYSGDLCRDDAAGCIALGQPPTATDNGSMRYQALLGLACCVVCDRVVGRVRFGSGEWRSAVTFSLPDFGLMLASLRSSGCPSPTLIQIGRLLRHLRVEFSHYEVNVAVRDLILDRDAATPKQRLPPGYPTDWPNRLCRHGEPPCRSRLLGRLGLAHFYELKIARLPDDGLSDTTIPPSRA